MNPRTLPLLALCALACLSLISATRDLKDEPDATETPSTPLVGSYPDVTIHDSTPYNAWGHVSYAVCKGDDYSLTPQTKWSHSRGVCLLKKITATVRTPQGDIEAEPYTSSGTSYSQFAVIQTGPSSFVVTRIVS